MMGLPFTSMQKMREEESLAYLFWAIVRIRNSFLDMIRLRFQLYLQLGMSSKQLNV